MQLPPRVVASQVFVQGGAFRKHHEFRNEGIKKRFFFVLNKNPGRDNVIILATTTTELESHKSKYGSEVLVEITRDEYKPLDEKCLISCENVRAFQKSHIQNFIDNNEITPLRSLPENILKKVCSAIAKCKVVPPADKLLVLGEDDG